MLLGRHLNKYYLKYWWMFVLGIMALIAVDLAQTYIPEFVGQIVDFLSEGTGIHNEEILKMSLYVLLIAVIMFLGRMIWRYTLFNASQRIEAGLRRDMFKKSEKLSQRYFHETKVGSIMSWFTTDLETIEEYMGFGTVQLVDAFFLGILVILKMVSLDWVLSIISFIPMLCIVIWGGLVEKFMGMKWEERQGQYDKLYDFSQENFTGIRVIKAFVKETSEIHAFAKEARKARDTNLSFTKFSVMFDVIIELLIAITMAMLVGFGAWFVYSFVTETPVVILGHTIELSAGNLITFVGLFDTLIWPLIALGSLITMRSRAKTSLKRVSAFLDQEEEIKNPENPYILKDIEGKITFKNFDFSYPSNKDKKVLQDISFTINPGEKIGIVGRIGSGKTSLVNSLLRLYNLEKETLFIDDYDIMDCDIQSVRDSIAYVPQDNFLFSDKISKNISFGKNDATEEDIYEAAKFADVHSNILEFPEKYDTVTGERGVTLSGGQKQRISIARAFIKDSPILILDDSVSAVDVKTEETILNNIIEKRRGKTTLVIASRVSTVMGMDKIIVLKEGALEAFDTPEKLQQSSPTFQKMVYLQQLEKEVEGGDR